MERIPRKVDPGEYAQTHVVGNLFPQIIKDKWNELPMNDRLTSLVKRVAKVHEAGLKACHYIEEFHLWRIRSLGHWENLAFECPLLSHPNRESDEGKSAFFSIHQ
jgi:hypothetical protein